MLKERRNPELSTTTEPDRLELTFYADPLCCWSWALLPEIERTERRFANRLRVSVCLGGLISAWSRFADPLHAVSRPAQMGPVWMDASTKTGIPFNTSIWVDDPPASSYPACIAIKTATLQSPGAGRLYLKAAMEAVMIQGRNIAREQTLIDIAGETEDKHPDVFNAGLFLEQYNGPESRSEFLRDLQKVKMNQIGRFPTVTITACGRRGIIFTGYRPYETIVQALCSVAPEWRS